MKAVFKFNVLPSSLLLGLQIKYVLLIRIICHVIKNFLDWSAIVDDPISQSELYVLFEAVRNAYSANACASGFHSIKHVLYQRVVKVLLLLHSLMHVQPHVCMIQYVLDLHEYSKT